MATSNLYAVGPERVNHAPLSPLSVLKCAARIYPKCICVILGRKQYTRKESDNRCIGKGQRNAVAVLRPIATVSDCHFGVPPVFLATTKHTAPDPKNIQ